MSSSSSSYSKKTSGSHRQTKHEYRESSGNAGGLLSGGDFPDLKSTSLESSDSKGQADLEKAQSALKERAAQLDERETELKKQQEALTEREDALDAAHERLIGAEVEAEDKDENAGDSASAAIIDELRKENENLRAELAAAKQKKPPRFLSQRFADDDASGNDRFKLSEKKGLNGAGGSLPMGFDPLLMERWRSGHQMMSPRKPRPESSRPDGK